MFFDSYATLGGLNKVIPVDFYIPGCPPRPEAILYGVAVALGLAPKKAAPVVSAQVHPEEILRKIEQGEMLHGQK
jgi:NADH:ubiquinone oxidoreductase subunit B-like Fe-S oxidoreductase